MYRNYPKKPMTKAQCVVAVRTLKKAYAAAPSQCTWMTLTKSERTEIYEALETKIINLQLGKYGPSVDGEVNIPKWIKQLERIQRKVEVKS